MRGFVFIGWREDNSLAIEVKKLLDQKGYLGIVGGDYEGNPIYLRQHQQAINATIQFQMDRCSQAIFIFTANSKAKKNDTSGNMLYELGYLSSRLKKSAFVFKVDLPPKNTFPSDLEGIWGYDVFSPKSKDVDAKKAVAEDIVNKFLLKQSVSDWDCLQLIKDYHHIEYKIDCHIESPIISDYKLAIQLLFYIQAVYIYQDYSVAKTKCLALLKEVLQKNKSKELILSLEYAILTCELFEVANPYNTGNTRVYMGGKSFRRFLTKYREFASVLLDDNSDIYNRNNQFKLENALLQESKFAEREFSSWLLTQIQGHVALLHLIYLDNPNLLQSERIKLSNQAIEIGTAAVKNLLVLEQFDGCSNYVKLLLAYAYRNLAVFYRITEKKEKEEEAEKNSQIMRTVLYNLICNDDSVRPTFRDYVILEYYLQLADTIDEISDAATKNDLLDEIDDFINKLSSFEKNRMSMFEPLTNLFEK